MIEEIAKVEELLNRVKTSSGKNDYCVICYKDQEEQIRELFPCEKIHVLPESFNCNELNNKVFVIPIDEKISVKVICEGEE